MYPTLSSQSSDKDRPVYSASTAIQAYEDLYAVIAIVLPDYTEALVRALGVFFHDYEEAVRSSDQNGLSGNIFLPTYFF